MIKYIISAFIIYILFGLILFIFQRKILFNISDKPKKPEDYRLNNVIELKILTIADIAKKKYFIYTVKYLILDKFDNFSKINKILSPILIISGKKDEVIPHSHSKKLFLKAKNPKKDLFIDEVMHNNLYDFNIDKEVIEFNSLI